PPSGGPQATGGPGPCKGFGIGSIMSNTSFNLFTFNFTCCKGQTMAPAKESKKDSKNEEGKDKDDDKKMYKDTAISKILKKIFVVTNYIQVGIGLLVVIISFVGLLASPQLAAIAFRMLTAGLAMSFQGLVSVAFSKICCCCKGLNATCLRMAFLSSFAATFELFLFGGAYLFFQQGWQDMNMVTGNRQYTFKMTLDNGGNIDTLISRHHT
ncbi:MAG: hypothetical protein EZS28_044968, partial [Streblomastix strix]